MEIIPKNTPIGNDKKELLGHAKGYLARGYSVIPVKKDKKPLIRWEEYQRRLPTVAELESWFENSLVAGIGIITGKVSGLVAVDTEAGANLSSMDFGTTVEAHSGGGGRHFYYRYPQDVPIGRRIKLWPDIDVLGDGGYVIAPPSLHSSGNFYSWIRSFGESKLLELPRFVIEKCAAAEGVPSEQKLMASSEVLEGKRNDAATVRAGELLREYNTAEWEDEAWPKLVEWNIGHCKPPLDKKELRTIWNSIVKREKRKAPSDGKGKKDKQTVAEIYWLRPRDGRIVEAYYDPAKEETGLLVFEGGKSTKARQILVNDLTHTAPPPTNNLVRPGFVKLPSEALAFESEVLLLKDVKGFIHDYVQIPADFEDIAAFYALFSWVYDDFHELPYLRVIGDYGSGKSRFLKVMGALCYHSIFLSGSASASAIFRMIHQIRGTLVFDEADLRLSDTSNEVIKILNSGFQKGIPVFRSEASGKNLRAFDPTPFDVFGPKVIATRKDFMDDALESRCLSNPMEALTRKDIPENLEDGFEERALRIRNKLVMFRFQKLSSGISKEPLPKIGIEPRLRQIISPLYRVVSDQASKEIILNFIECKQKEVFERRFGSLDGEVLQSLLGVLRVDQEPTMKVIAEAYNDSFGGKYPIKPKKVGSILEQTFHLEKRKTAQGIQLCASPENTERIEKLKVKFGIDEPKMNIVNDMNIPQDEQLRIATEVFQSDAPKENNS